MRDLIIGTHFADAADQAASLDSTGVMLAASVQRFSGADVGGQEMAQRMLLGKGV